MKITKIECLPLIYKYEEPIYDALFIARQRQALLIKVHTDSGITGIGEAGCFGGPLISTVTLVKEEIAPRIIGMDPLNYEQIWQKTYWNSWQHGRGGVVINALSGVDMALWDIMGKAANMPLYKLLGGYTNRAMAYASSGFYKSGKEAQHIAEDMVDYVNAGYRAVKMKVARNAFPPTPLKVMPDPDYYYSVEEDINRVEIAKKAVGSEIKMIVDANAAWDTKTALAAGRQFDKFGIYAFEEPVAPDNEQGSAHLAESLDLKIAGYESAQLAYNFNRLIQNKCIDIVQPDLSWAGGITECRKIASIAFANHKEVAPHCFSSAIVLQASLHFLCGISNGGMLEMDQNPNGLRTEIVKEPLTIDKDGFVTVPEKPGLGIELNELAIEKYLVKI